MVLPKGITGFYDAKEEQISMVDQKQFKQFSFSILPYLDGTVIEFNNQCYHENFINTEIKWRNTKVHILLNKHYPIVAFASHVESGSVTFIDEPTLSERFRSSYQVLSFKELNQPVLLNLGAKKSLLQNENELSQVELKQVAYWKPKTIGEIIFNQWD